MLGCCDACGLGGDGRPVIQRPSTMGGLLTPILTAVSVIFPPLAPITIPAAAASGVRDAVTASKNASKANAAALAAQQAAAVPAPSNSILDSFGPQNRPWVIAGGAVLGTIVLERLLRR